MNATCNFTLTLQINLLLRASKTTHITQFYSTSPKIVFAIKEDITVWKFKNFSSNEILREINIGFAKDLSKWQEIKEFPHCVSNELTHDWNSNWVRDLISLHIWGLTGITSGLLPSHFLKHQTLIGNYDPFGKIMDDFFALG